MNRVIVFLIGLLLSFNFSSTVVASPVPLDSLLLKLEKDLRGRANKKEVEKQVQNILRGKEALPVNYLPELNYLLGKEIEKVPKTELSSVKKIAFFSAVFRRAFSFLLFLVSFFSLLYFFQKVEIDDSYKHMFSAISVATLTISFLFNLYPVFLAFSAFALIATVRFKKWIFLIVGSVSLVVTVLACTFEENAVNYVASPEVLYSIKLERDGYLPEYLLEEVLKEPLSRELERASNMLAVGNLKGGELLREISAKKLSREYKRLVYNNLGFYYFLKEDYQTAKRFFELADSLGSTQETKYNLYLTYSALLEFERANALMAELEKGLINEAKGVPVLLHVSPPEWRFHVSIVDVLAVIAGIVAGIVLEKRFPMHLGAEEYHLIGIPGMLSYMRNRVYVFVLTAAVVLLVNLLIGSWLCSI